MKSSHKLSIFGFKLIRDIYEARNSSETARLNNITQPAVSKHVKEISSNLCEVFLRENKKVALASKGREVYHFVNRTLLAYNDLFDKLTSDSEQAIVLGSDISYFKTFLSTIQKSLPEHHRLNVWTYNNSRSIFEALLNDQIGLGIMSGSYTQKGVLKIQLRADRLTIIGQKELIEAFDNGQETLFLLYHTTSSYHNFLEEFIKISQFPTQHHPSIDDLSPTEHEVLSDTEITIVGQDIADRMLTNDNTVISSQKLRDVFIRTYVVIKMDNTYYQDLTLVT